MKNLIGSINQFRVATARYGLGDETCGTFMVPSPVDGNRMFVIASSGGGWDHVSVSREKRCPNWPEMDHVKKLFFRDEETVVQYHVPTIEHVNFMPYCLHLWRPHGVEVPQPPAWMVGPVAGQTAEESEQEGHAALKATGEV